RLHQGQARDVGAGAGTAGRQRVGDDDVAQVRVAVVDDLDRPGSRSAVPEHLLVGLVGGRLDDRDVRGDHDRVLALGPACALGAVVVVVSGVAGDPVVGAGLVHGDCRR